MARFSRISKNFWQGSFSQNFRKIFAGVDRFRRGNIIFAQFSEKWRDLADLAVSPRTFRREEITCAEFSQNFRGSGQISQARNHFRRIYAKFSKKWVDLAVSPTIFRTEAIIFAEFSQNFRGHG